MNSLLYFKTNKRLKTKLRPPNPDDFMDENDDLDEDAFQKASNAYVQKIKQIARSSKNK